MLEPLLQEIEKLKVDVNKFQKKGVKEAAIRARRHLSNIRIIVKKIRAEIQAKVKEKGKRLFKTTKQEKQMEHKKNTTLSFLLNNH
jgi:hypothetical protein